MESIRSKVSSAVNGRSSNSGKGKTVLITGGSGFVAAEVLNAFLSRGYHVRTTVRNQNSADKVRRSHAKYLDQIDFAFVEDIQTVGAFDEAVKGVDGVIHTASPFVLSVKDNKKDLLDPAINGTLQVLSSVAAYNPSVKRVVITSSFAAIWNGNKGNWPEHNYTESDWNPMTYEEASKKDTDGALAYCASKTLAERAAFDFVKEKKLNFQVTTICPPMVYGPLSHEVSDLKSLNTSSAEIYNLMNGSKTTVPDTSFFAFVDVRDVGEAHALAYENEEAAGQRYLVTGGSFTFQNICDIIRKDFPELRRKIPEGTPGAPLPAVYRVDNEKARKELGIKFRNLETTIHDQVLVFLELEKKFGTTSA